MSPMSPEAEIINALENIDWIIEESGARVRELQDRPTLDLAQGVIRLSFAVTR